MPTEFVLSPNWRQVVGESTFLGGRQLSLRTMALAIETCPRAPAKSAVFDTGGNFVKMAPRDSSGGPPLYASHFRTESLDPELGWIMRIGAAKKYAYFVHQGTKRHIIPGNPLLAFNWKKIGRFMILRSVNHPGTKPQPWLWRAANVIIRSKV